MGWLIYLSGSALFFLLCLSWNRAVQGSETTSQKDKDETTLDLSTALFLSLMSWGAFVGVFIILAIGTIAYGLIESDWSKKVNKWFTKGTKDESSENQQDQTSV